MGNTQIAELTEDRSDTKRAVVMHKASGEMYIVEYCSLWTDETIELAHDEGGFYPAGETAHNQECVGTRIIAAAGPIVRRDLLADDQSLDPAPWLFDRIDAWEDLTDENAAWLQAEEDAGLIDYPVGAR